jgi:putative ABC transport system permease protein
MSFTDVIRNALEQILANRLRSFFTTLGILVSVAFLVAVVAVIQGMNAYVSENLVSALLGTNSFHVRRTPIQIGLVDDGEWQRMQRRPRITRADAEAVAEAIPDAIAVGLQSGFPTPIADVIWRDRSLSGVAIRGVTPAFQDVHDYRFSEGNGLSEIDILQRRYVVVLGGEIAEKLFENVSPVGRSVKIRGVPFTVIGVIARKGKVLGQSSDSFVLMPLTSFEMLYGRRSTTTISVKMPTAEAVAKGMAQAEEAMRISHRLRPFDENDFSVETADALVSFWKNLTRVLFSVIPAVVGIGVVVGGIVIMNIMLMAVNERTREIGIRKSVGATTRDISRQFLAESIALSALGGAGGVLAGWLIAFLVAAASPLPARVTPWSVVLALVLGAGVGILFGVYPARRAARLDPITALRAE